MNSFNISPKLIRWARLRSGKTIEHFSNQFKKLAEWEDGISHPTYKQLENFAKATYVPFGYLFLPEPPDEKIPIPDLRTIINIKVRNPSPNLLDTIYLMQRRQSWLREERREFEVEPYDFVGSAQYSDNPLGVGREMRRIVGLRDGWADSIPTWREAVGQLRKQIEKLGVMTVINGVVGNNTHRKLDIAEFRGFALSDEFAPLIFINGVDVKSAQMFTMGHELAHIWLGSSALSDSTVSTIPNEKIESWCDQVAAEFLVPELEFRDCWRKYKNDVSPFEHVARHFKVSPIVASRRAMDLHFISKQEFFDFYNEYTTKEFEKSNNIGGGDFFNNQNTRVGEMFATQVIFAAKSGRLSFKEAYDLTGLKGGTFQEYANRLGIPLP